MRRIIIALACLLSTCIPAFAQGIYKTSEEYLQQRLSYKPAKGSKHSINADRILNPSGIKVVSDGETILLSKQDVYGYRNARQQDFRFFNNAVYRIIDSQHFMLYSREVNTVRGKDKTRGTRYYFSVHAGAPILPLTKSALKASFAANVEFRYLIDLHFSDDRSLIAYDQYERNFKLKLLFRRAQS